MVVTAVVMFLPGVLERVKFTNGLVAHVHLAMAGMTSSFLMVLLVVLGTPSGLGSVLSNRTAFVLWHAGLCIYLGSMLYVSSLESHHVDILYRTYVVRAAAAEFADVLPLDIKLEPGSHVIPEAKTEALEQPGGVLRAVHGAVEVEVVFPSFKTHSFLNIHGKRTELDWIIAGGGGRFGGGALGEGDGGCRKQER